MSNFSSIGTALSGLQAAQAGLLISSQNVAGSAVDGYSRRRAEVTMSQLALDSRVAGGTVFAVDGFSRDYSQVLEAQRGSQRGLMRESETLVQGSSTVDAMVMDAASSVGSALDKFFAAAGSLARDPTNIAFRSQFFGTARQVAERVNGVVSNIETLKSSAEYSLNQSLDNANRLAAQLADVNQKITETTGFGAAGASADLLDRRDQLLMALQEEIGGQVSIAGDGMASLYVNGNPLVDRNGAGTLTYGDGAVYLSFGSNAVSTGQRITLNGNAAGRATANYTLANTFVPELEARIGAISKYVADSVNGSVSGMQPVAADGMNLFSYVEDPDTGAVSQFMVRQDLDSNTSTVTASEASAIEALRQDPDGAIQQWAEFTTYVGGTVASWKADHDSAVLVTQKLDLDHENVSGVNLDEEAANLVKFQQLYGALSKVLQVSGELFDRLLNTLN